MFMIKRRLFSVVLTIVCVIMVVSVSRAAEVIKLKYANYLPTTSSISQLSSDFCDEIKKRTNGRVEISYYPGGTLLTAPRMFDGVVQGLADIGMAHLAYTRGRFPVMEVLNLPLGFSGDWVAGHVANDYYDKYKPKEFETVHPLYFSGVSPFVIYTAKKPVRTLEDLKGMKIRGVGLDGDILKALGATPVPFEMSDVYEALRRGVLEGANLSLEPLKNFRFGEVVKYVTASWRVGSNGVFYVVMNKDKWNSLPPDIKKIFDEVVAEYKEKTFRAWTQADIDGIEFLKSKGGQVIVRSIYWPCQIVGKRYQREILSVP